MSQQPQADLKVGLYVMKVDPCAWKVGHCAMAPIVEADLQVRLPRV